MELCVPIDIRSELRRQGGRERGGRGGREDTERREGTGYHALPRASLTGRDAMDEPEVRADVFAREQAQPVEGTCDVVTDSRPYGRARTQRGAGPPPEHARTDPPRFDSLSLGGERARGGGG